MSATYWIFAAIFMLCLMAAMWGPIVIKVFAGLMAPALGALILFLWWVLSGADWDEFFAGEGARDDD